MTTENIKNLASEASAKKSEIQLLVVKLEETGRQARIPRPASVEKVKVPLHFDGPVSISRQEDQAGGARTYTLDKRVTPAENDPLEELRNKRQEELGLAHIEGRAPNVGEYDGEIAKIEGARAALPILERQLDAAKEQLEESHRQLHAALVPELSRHFADAEKGYFNAVDGLRTALGEMLGVSQLAERLGGHTHFSGRVASYVAGVRDKGIVVSREGGFYAPDWIFGKLDLPAASTKTAEVTEEFARLGVTL